MAKIRKKSSKGTTTSEKAAQKNRPRSEKQRREVAVALCSPSTREELEQVLGLGGSSVRPRVVELIEKGYVVPTDKRRLTKTGSQAEVLALTYEGVEYVEEIMNES